jgi:hypothetical protein
MLPDFTSSEVIRLGKHSPHSVQVRASDTVHSVGSKAGVSPLGTAKEELTDNANEVSKKKALSKAVINKFNKRMLFCGFEEIIGKEEREN